MKKALLLLAVLLITINSLLISGCGQTGNTGTVTVITANASDSAAAKTPDSAESSTAVSSAPSPALIKTTTPENTKAPEKTPEPSVSQSGDEQGKVVIADGFYYYKLDENIKKRITGMSYPSKGQSCKITYDDLRYIRLKYYDFDGKVHDGELIVNTKLAKEVTEIFYKLYQNKYPFTSIKLVDDYGEPGDDNLSMAANNTSAFNYRYVTGTKTLSLHSYGEAIDINPMMNPYIVGDRVAPPNGAKYTDRSLKLPGMIDRNDLCYKIFKEYGWKWNGDSAGDKDYQHFSKKL